MDARVGPALDVEVVIDSPPCVISMNVARCIVGTVIMHQASPVVAMAYQHWRGGSESIPVLPCNGWHRFWV
jgi:hypothetical protein